MKLTLNNDDCEAALIAHIGNMGFDIEGCSFEIVVTKGRKSGEITADVDVIKPVPSPLKPQIGYAAPELSDDKVPPTPRQNDDAKPVTTPLFVADAGESVESEKDGDADDQKPLSFI